MQTMIRDLNDAFAAAVDTAGNRYFNWKPSSLEVLSGGPHPGPKVDNLTLDQGGETLTYKPV